MFSLHVHGVFGRLAVLTPAEGVPAPSHIQDRSVPMIPGMESQCRQFISDSSQSFEYLGLAFRSDLEVVHLADHLLAKLQRELTTFRSQIFVTPRNFQSLLELLNFLAPLGRLRMHRL